MDFYLKQLKPLIKEYKGESKERLSVADVDNLCDLIKATINLNEGNISETRYNDVLSEFLTT